MLYQQAAYIWDNPWTVVKILFTVNRYGNLIGQTFIILEETGYLSRGSQRVCLFVFLRHLLSFIAHQFCTAYELFISSFVILTGESIRREYPVTLQNVYSLTVKHSFGRAARLCDPGMQAPHYIGVEFTIHSLCYRSPCIVTLLARSLVAGYPGW